MGQVPTVRPLALLGSGRVATHMQHYLKLLGIPAVMWARCDDPRFNSSHHCDPEQRLADVIRQSDRLWLLVSDSAVAPLAEKIQTLDPDHRCLLMHASGSLNINGIITIHPLMTFANTLYPLTRYQSIPLVTEPSVSMSRCLPELPNRSYAIHAEQRALYHSLCVISGNFAQILWHQCRDEMQQSLNLPSDVLMPYLQQVCENFVRTPDSALTGPLVRGDVSTIEQHLDALRGHPLEPVYRSILACYQPGHAETL